MLTLRNMDNKKYITYLLMNGNRHSIQTIQMLDWNTRSVI